MVYDTTSNVGHDTPSGCDATPYQPLHQPAHDHGLRHGDGAAPHAGAPAVGGVVGADAATQGRSTQSEASNIMWHLCIQSHWPGHEI